MVIWRFDASGALDPAFAGNGVAINNGAAGSNGDDAGNAITIDSRGRVLVAGSSRNVAGDIDLALWRFDPDGSIDITFASDGIVANNSAAGGNAGDSGNAVTTDADGRIYVAGSSSNGSGDADMVAWKFLP
jgi:uncharacterized delta-60 repeat protein